MVLPARVNSMRLSPAHSLLLADSLLVIHFLFVAFVVVGQAMIMFGAAARWRWVKNRWFRIAHLMAIGVVAAQAWAGRYCPLTVWENALRHAAGEEGYATGFVAHWAGLLIYYDAPLWVFTVIYTLFAMLVAIYWFVARPERNAR